MFTTQRIQIERQRRKRQLRQRLARSRRRIDADTRAVGRAALERLIWRTHVHRHPIVALGAAAGIGVAVALFPSAGRVARWLTQAGGSWITRFTSYAVLRSVVRTLRTWRQIGGNSPDGNNSDGEHSNGSDVTGKEESR
jgi:hypothetical protein